MNFLKILLSNLYFLVFLSGLLAFFLSIKIFPAIIYLSNTKNLMDTPDDRSMHLHKTPTLGGIGIFIAFSLTIIFFGIFTQFSQPDMIKLLSLLGGIIILLFLGIKDDILVLSPKKKIIGQIVSATMVVLMTDVRISDFNGLLGIGELSPVFSIIFTIFTFVFIINAYNLADGIDGLAASIAIISCTAFGLYFIFNENYLMSFISCALIGALLSFLRFNLSKTQKMFMGDSGSMFVGFLLAFQGINLFTMNGLTTTSFTFNSGYLIVMAAFSFPIIDTTRVFFIRLKQGKSPFSADRNHIHHKLVDLGLNHVTATLVISTINVVVLFLALVIDSMDMDIHIKLLIVIIFAPILYLCPFFIEQEKKGWKTINA